MSDGDYTYKQYLQNWQDHFGDAETGITRPTVAGKEIEVPLTRLTEEQFEQHKAELDRLNAEFNDLDDQNRAAYEAEQAGGDPDDAAAVRRLAAIDANLSESFQHELALLV